MCNGVSSVIGENLVMTLWVEPSLQLKEMWRALIMRCGMNQEFSGAPHKQALRAYKLGYLPIASKAEGLATFRKKF